MNLSKPTKVLFIGVFDKSFKSTNTSQLLSFKNNGVDVVGYNYRDKAAIIGEHQRDLHLVETVKNNDFDLVVFSKCNKVSYDTFKEITKKTKTCLWFMDPLITYNKEMQIKTSLVDYFCCDKKDVLQLAKTINKNSYHVFEGFDSKNDFPIDCIKEHDVTFIGNIYGDRKDKLASITTKVNVVSNAFGRKHADVVSRSKINLNFCTSNGASDRVYKTLAAKGFLLTDDWEGRDEIFKDNQDLVIYKDIDDLNNKIEFYLDNWEQAEAIANHGYKTVQKFTRSSWAKRIIQLYEQIR